VSSGGLPGEGLAAAVARVTAREDPAVTREEVLEGCDLGAALRGMKEIAFVAMSSLPSEERESKPQFFGLVAAKAVAGEA
jgi:hypothetical protein